MTVTPALICANCLYGVNGRCLKARQPTADIAVCPLGRFGLSLASPVASVASQQAGAAVTLSRPSKALPCKPCAAKAKREAEEAAARAVAAAPYTGPVCDYCDGPHRTADHQPDMD